ncbi:hypothetical protein [Aquabacterium sp. OR-4]|uniref:hypothetical protein n=1 Tax=Aquabacterium sp. OR-4 TaxID=2978127 RepID=UPI0021B20918|nr:hypothetical protein [Aquabacterium sp. OR-4]MDT7835201.1 hypothetical protein [Aquabacterium sp. OR-4]
MPTNRSSSNTDSSPRRALLSLAATSLVALASGAVLISATVCVQAQQTAGTTGATTAAATTPTPADSDGGFAAAFARFSAAKPGDEAAIEAATAQFNKLLAAAPTDPVLRAYAGASTSMRATTTLLPWKKMGHAEDGLALVDKALAQLGPAHDAPSHLGVPAVLLVKFTAANTFLAMPGMFNRGERGHKLLDDVLKSPLFEPSPAPFKATVWLRAGQQAATDQQPALARQWYEKAAASSTPQAAVARSRLQAL